MKLIDLFRNFSLKKKLIGLYIGFVVIPIVLILSIVIPLIKTTIANQEYESRIQLLSVMAESVEMQMDSIEHDILQLYNLHGIFHTETTSPIAVRKELYEFFSGQSYVRHMLYVTNEDRQYSVLTSTMDSAPNNVLLSLAPELKEELEKANGDIVWFAPNSGENKNSSRFFVCGVMIKNIHDDGHKTAGYAYFLLERQTVAGIFDTMRLGEHDTVCILDQNGNTVWKSEDASLPEIYKSWEGYKIENDAAGMERFYVYKRSEKNNWLFLYSTPLSELNFYSTIFLLSLSIVLLFLLLCLFAQSIMISKVFVRPIQKLVVGFDLMEISHEIPLQPVKRRDEIGILTQSAIQMQQRLNTLLADIELSHKKELQQELTALQAQINPHFIYNTLDAISWMAREKEQFELNEILIRFSRILRYSISEKKRSATIKDEIQWGKEYAALLQMQKKGLFRLVVKADPTLYHSYTFRLILQPFLENAILHGFRHMNCGGIILLSVQKQKNDIKIVIKDNGTGIPENRIHILCSHIENGIGIYNVHRRIRLCFGDKYGVSVCSHNGTKITILIPQITDPEQLG